MDWIKPAIASGIFLAVIAIVLFDWIHLTIVSLLGAIVLVFLRIISVEDAVQSVSENYSTFVLLFGVMVIVRSFEPTGIFAYLATQIARSARSGKHLLLGVIVGASCNIIAAGVAEQNNRRITFKQFLNYSIPIMTVQLCVSAVYIVILWIVT
jgi:Na+/H+ antiporter NhaD/arsenite permease-like protein